MSMIRYGDYVGRAEFDEDIGLFAARVLNLPTPVTFSAPTAEGLPAELAVSIETYLARPLPGARHHTGSPHSDR